MASKYPKLGKCFHCEIPIAVTSPNEELCDDCGWVNVLLLNSIEKYKDKNNVTEISDELEEELYQAARKMYSKVQTLMYHSAASDDLEKLTEKI